MATESGLLWSGQRRARRAGYDTPSNHSTAADWLTHREFHTRTGLLTARSVDPDWELTVPASPLHQSGGRCRISLPVTRPSCVIFPSQLSPYTFHCPLGSSHRYDANKSGYIPVSHIEAMLDERGILETVHEQDIDLLIVQEVHCSPRFREWFVEALGGTCAELTGAWRSVTRYNGETDVQIAFRDSTGETVLLLVENKIKEQEQPRQAARYAERADRYVRDGIADRAMTCLIAPDEYIDEEIESKYDRLLEYEQLRSWYADQADDRSKFVASMFDEAIKYGRQRYVKSTDEHTQAFWAYYETLAAEYPKLEFSVDHTPASGTTWFRFTPSVLADGSSITHKADRGVVHLSLAGLGPRVGELRRVLEAVLEEDMRIEKTHKSASIAVDVPAFDDLSSPEEQTDAIQAGLETAVRLLEWERQHHATWIDLGESR